LGSDGAALPVALAEAPVADWRELELEEAAELDEGAEQQVAAGALDVVAALPCAEQQLGTTGLGAPTPAMSEPRPSFCSVGASSFPLESRPFADWNFSRAATMFESSFPFGSPS